MPTVGETGRRSRPWTDGPTGRRPGWGPYAADMALLDDHVADVAVDVEPQLADLARQVFQRFPVREVLVLPWPWKRRQPNDLWCVGQAVGIGDRRRVGGTAKADEPHLEVVEEVRTAGCGHDDVRRSPEPIRVGRLAAGGQVLVTAGDPAESLA